MSNSITRLDDSLAFFERDVGIRLLQKEFRPKDLLVIGRVCTLWRQIIENLDIWSSWSPPEKNRQCLWYHHFSDFASQSLDKVYKAHQLILTLEGDLYGSQKSLLEDTLQSGFLLWKGDIVQHSDLETIACCLVETCPYSEAYSDWVTYQYEIKGSLEVFEAPLSNPQWQTRGYARVRLSLLRKFAMLALQQDKSSYEKTLSFILDKEKDKKIRFKALECVYNHLITNKIDRPDLLEKIIDSAPIGDVAHAPWFEGYLMRYDAVVWLTEFIWSQYGKDKKEAVRLAKKYLPNVEKQTYLLAPITIDLHIILGDLHSAFNVYKLQHTRNSSYQIVFNIYCHLEKRLKAYPDGDKYLKRLHALPPIR